MAYTVYSPMDEDGAQASGLSLTEAFARMMALARYDYAFGRIQGDLVLSLTPADGDLPIEPPPGCRSKLQDSERARAEIMRRFLKSGIGGYRMVTDEDWQREENMRAAQSGVRPARRLDAE